MTPEEIVQAEERVGLAWKALNHSDAKPTRILAPDGAPCPTLIKWAMKHGISLDWVIIGDVTPLIIESGRFGAALAG